MAFILLLIFLTPLTALGAELAEVRTPVGPKLALPVVAERIKSSKTKFITFTDVLQRLQDSASNQTVIYLDASYQSQGELKVLKDELSSNFSITVITTSSATTQFVRNAERLTQRLNPVQIFQIVSAKDLQWFNFTDAGQATFVVHEEREFANLNPYGHRAENLKRHDRFGRDLLGLLLLQASQLQTVSEVCLFDYGAKLFPLAAELLARLKYEGIEKPSAPIVFRWLDHSLGRQYSGGKWGLNVLHLLANDEQISHYLQDTSEGIRAAEFIQYDYRIYVDARTHFEEEDAYRTSERWRAGEIPVKRVDKNALRQTKEFREVLMSTLQHIWSHEFTTIARQEAWKAQDPRLELGQTPLVLASLAQSKDISWLSLREHLLLAEAFELIRLESVLLAPSSPLLEKSRQFGHPISLQEAAAEIKFRQRTAEVGKAKAERELGYLNKLNENFYSLLQEAPKIASQPMHSTYLYHFRKELVNRGQDFDGRLKPLLSVCFELISRVD